jgi:hypothetical protein
MKRLLLITGIAVGVLARIASAATAPSPWEQPAGALAEQISQILGPGQALLTIRNLSSIPTDEIPSIRRLLEQDLKTHGVLASGAESANSIRVTLSENARERLWVAEVIQGNESRVAMVHVDPQAERTSATLESIVLRKERLPFLFDSLPGALPGKAVTAAIETNSEMLVLGPEEIGLFSHGEAIWKAQRRLEIKPRPANPRDPRGLLIRSADGQSFTAFVPGTECTGTYSPTKDSAVHPEDSWSLRCHESDDPWPILQADASTGSPGLKAFYNPARNYFTGLVTPSLGVDLPPFYSAALLPRPGSNAALVIGGIDGKVQLVENDALKTVAGARDWGSDFAALHSGCGAGTQIVASGSGEAASDSLRAYELPAQEAIPVSAPLTMEGTVTALWTAPDGKSVYAVVRSAADEYEVDRVTASCNE